MRELDGRRLGRELPWRRLDGGDIELRLRPGQEAIVYASGTRPDLTIAPVPITQPGPAWGLPI